MYNIYEYYYYFQEITFQHLCTKIIIAYSNNQKCCALLIIGLHSVHCTDWQRKTGKYHVVGMHKKKGI